MNLLAIDIGNSRCKSCFGRVEEGFPAETFESIELSEIESHFQNFSTFDCCVVSSVNTEASNRIRKALDKKVANRNIIFLNSKNSPIALKINAPETVGSDRIAAAIGAHQRNRTKSVVIDSGTAVTIDVVDDDGAFLGGAIFPGTGLALRALAQGTNKLPGIDLEKEIVPETLGKNTASAIQAGVFWSHIGATERIVKNLKKEFGEMPAMVTGGNGKAISDYSEFQSLYCSTLVLEGLWAMGVTTR